MAIQLYNTKTRGKVPFTPIDPKNVRMYVCGPTVYDRAHLGNARPVIVFDTLFRLLRHEYGADHVTYVRNFTDVDDKINATALARQDAGASGTLEELIAQRSDETIAWYLEDMAAVGAMEPTQAPRATQYIAQMIAMIEDLIAKDHAYAAEGHALFRVRSYKDYGALSGRSVDDMIAGARVEVAPYKEDPMDFVLWKPSSDDQPGWDSPWGRGRPGWHIECSAMAFDLLGAEFDIHGGGNDLTFPHHENEIAQSCCANDTDEMARYWMHNEMLQVEGKKMSKSLGNFFTVRDLLDEGVPGEVIRFVMLSTHYRKPMDWTEKKRVEAEKTLRGWYGLLSRHESYVAPPHASVVRALKDDMNSSLALAELNVLFARVFALLNNGVDELEEFGSLDEALATFASSLQLVGLLNSKIPNWARQSQPEATYDDWFFLGPIVIGNENADAIMEMLTPILAKYGAAIDAKNFIAADKVRDELLEIGLQVSVNRKDKVIDTIRKPTFDPAKLEGLL